jgi:hypothetical protein
MYEHHSHRPLPLLRFFARLGLHFALATALIAGSLGLGMAGYAYFEHLGWCDAFLNASMLLGGMGPIEQPQTLGGKLFAGFYALYSGLLFLVSAGIVLGPLVHRMLHVFHWEHFHEGDADESGRDDHDVGTRHRRPARRDPREAVAERTPDDS